MRDSRAERRKIASASPRHLTKSSAFPIVRPAFGSRPSGAAFLFRARARRPWEARILSPLKELVR